MRAYYFGNMYLSSIQQGIQAAHVTHELFNKYPAGASFCADNLRDWSENHKTMILLNAGFGENIHTLAERFGNSENTLYPWAKFHEEEASLDGAVTCVGIVLPEKIYESAAYLRKLSYRFREDMIKSIRENGYVDVVDTPDDATRYELSKWEFELVLDLGNYGMAS